MADQPYKRPPITEAVIEVRYGTPIDAGVLESASGAFKAVYPAEQSVVNYDVSLNLPAEPAIHAPVAQVASAHGRRRSAADETELLLLWPASFVVAQLAPYPGWDSFFGRFTRDWRKWKDLLGYRKIVRIGLRYINRIDIPREVRTIEETEYVNAYPRVPAVFGSMMAYGLQAQFLPDDRSLRLTLNTSSVPSPLLDHMAILLDLDVASDLPPQRDEEVSALLGEMRTHKNAAFEACVTDRARELFQQ